jgi:hypothetical protein
LSKEKSRKEKTKEATKKAAAAKKATATKKAAAATKKAAAVAKKAETIAKKEAAAVAKKAAAAMKKAAATKKRVAATKKAEDATKKVQQEDNDNPVKIPECPKSFQKLNVCQEVLYGKYCIANIWELWDDFGRLTTINNVEKRYRNAYQDAIHVHSYLKHSILRRRNGLEPPPCMLDGSFVKAVNLIEFNKLNLTIRGQVKASGDKDEDKSEKDGNE